MANCRCRACYVEFGFWSLVVVAIVLIFFATAGCQSSAVVEPGRSSAKATSDERRPVVTESWKATVAPKPVPPAVTVTCVRVQEKSP